MRKHFKPNPLGHQNLDARDIWGINFFWTRDIKCSEEEIEKVTHNAMHKEQFHQKQFKKAS